MPCLCDACEGRGEKGDFESDTEQCQYHTYYVWEYWTISIHQGRALKLRAPDDEPYEEALRQVHTVFDQ